MPFFKNIGKFSNIFTLFFPLFLLLLVLQILFSEFWQRFFIFTQFLEVTFRHLQTKFCTKWQNFELTIMLSDGTVVIGESNAELLLNFDAIP